MLQLFITPTGEIKGRAGRVQPYSSTSGILLKRGDTIPVRIQFQDEAGQALPHGPFGQSGAAAGGLHIGIKDENDFLAIAFLAYAEYEGAPDEEGYFLLDFNLNTEELETLVASAAITKTTFEVVWSPSNFTVAGDERSSRAVLANIENDIHRGNEGTPTPLPGPDDWLDLRAVRFDEAQILTTEQKEQARANLGIDTLQITKTLLVANTAARLALSAEAALNTAVVEADTGDTYMLVQDGDPSVSGDWLQLGDRDVQWSEIGGKPTTFDPSAHTHPGTELDYAGTTEIGAALADADEIMVSDGGGNTTRRKTLVSRIWDYIKAKIDLGQTWAGAHAFSSTTRPTSAGTGTPSATSLITRTDENSLRTQNQNILYCPAFTGATSGTSLSNCRVHFWGFGCSDMTAGDAAGGYAWLACHHAPMGYLLFGSGINYGKKFKVAGSFILEGGGASLDSKHRFFFGAQTGLGSPPTGRLADLDMFTNEGVGFEIGYPSGNCSARITYHDGSTYKTSAWLQIATGAPGQTISHSFLLENNGSGGITLSINSSGSYEGPQSLVSGASSVSVNDGPTTSNSYFESWVGWLTCNHSTTITSTIGTIVAFPVTIDTQQ